MNLKSVPGAVDHLDLLDATEAFLADLLTVWMADAQRSEGQVHMEERATQLLNELRARKARRA